MSDGDEELLKRVELPPPSHSKSWFAQQMQKLDMPFILLLVIAAWSFGGYVNTNWVIQNQSDRINAQSDRLSQLQAQLNQQREWMERAQETQTTANKSTADLLATINLQLAEIKGATNAKRKR